MGKSGRSTRWARRGGIALAVATVLLAGIGVQPALAQVPPTTGGSDATDAPDPSVVSPDGVDKKDRDDLLGDGWEKSRDVAYTVLNGPDGLTILTASEKNGYEWTQVASIPMPPLETDLWISNHCITQSGRYMAVVYGPRSITNDPGNFGGSAWASIVDLRTGAVRSLGAGYSMAYFDPGCGGGDNVAITRYADEDSTLLAVVDAASGKVTRKVEATGTLTSAVPDAAGTLYAASPTAIVAVDAAGKQSPVTATPGAAYLLNIDKTGRLAFVTYARGEASAQVMSLGAERSKPAVIARGPVTELGVTVAPGGALYVLGDVKPTSSSDAATATFLPEAAPDAQVSSTGALAINEVTPVGMMDPEALSADEVGADIVAVPTDTAEELQFQVSETIDASESTAPGETKPSSASAAPAASGGTASADAGTASAGTVSTESLDIRALDGTPLELQAPAARTGSPTNPVELERWCSVPRNDPQNQAYQPKPRQVEWAVDMAVRGDLVGANTRRLANWRNLGMAQYDPQALFPRTTLHGYPTATIPPQIVLGVLSQESNLWQASRFTTPGETGNPLIGDFYGSRPAEGDPPSNIWVVDYADADCGYGVGQITDGMRQAGHERPGEVALPYAQQRAIALDYVANVAKAVQMIGQKWNEVYDAGMQINNGDPTRIENWFFAVWAYNTGFHPNTGGHWGVGWSNNPVNPIYPEFRGSFLDDSPSDAAHPQDWPYPEKVLGFAAHSLTLTETQTANPTTRTYPIIPVAGFRTSWWNGDGEVGETNRLNVKPPIDLFCTFADNYCNPSTRTCTLSGSPECWWHTDAVWKADCSYSCGYGFERFPATTAYDTEAESVPAGNNPSFPPNCASPPTGTLVVDDIPQSQLPVRSDCSQRPSQGSFGFEFFSPDSGGHYSAKIDLHQLGSGFNGHFYFSHMRKSNLGPDNVNNRLKIVGTWSLGSSLDQWTRIWVHLPDHAAWTEQAAYVVTTGNGVQTRYLPQRTYQNSWVPLGVFDVDGVPTVSLSNLTTTDDGINVDDIAWDAVGFQPLSAKPADFVVALGDSFSSGEGAGSYLPTSDHDGTVDDTRNGCHQSTNAWIRKTTLPGRTSTIGTLADSPSTSNMDYHFLACSGAESEQLLPYYTSGSDPVNGEGQHGDGQYGQVSQLDMGYLDSNTTLVTLSIGGNDMRFAPIVQWCMAADIVLASYYCPDSLVLDGDGGQNLSTATQRRLDDELPVSLARVLEAITDRAPNAKIVLMGYPKLFETSPECIMIGMQNQPWLNDLSDDLAGVMNQAAVDAATASGQTVVYVNPQPYFTGHNLCTSQPAINPLIFSFTPGDKPQFNYTGPGPNFGLGVSAQSVHPNTLGTTYYSQALGAALVGIYP